MRIKSTDETKYIPISWAKNITIALLVFEDEIA